MAAIHLFGKLERGMLNFTLILTLQNKVIKTNDTICYHLSENMIKPFACWRPQAIL